MEFDTAGVQADDTRNGVALVSRRYDPVYVNFSKDKGPFLKKKREFVSQYQNYEYCVMGEGSRGSGTATDPTVTAWGKIKTHTNPAAAGVCYYGVPGAIPMVNQANSLSGGTRLPGLLMSLTRIPNKIVSAGTVSPATANIMLPFVDTAGQFVWKNVDTGTTSGVADLQGIGIGGVYSSDLQQIKTTTSSVAGADVYPGRFAILKNVNLKLELWGQNKRPTKYHIVLCQLDDDIVPDIPSDTTTVTGRSATFGPVSQGTKFWVNEFKPYAHHPWSATYVPTTGRMKALWSDTVYIEAKSNEDQDEVPQCRMKNYTFNFNRKCHFDWAGYEGHNNTEDNVNDDYTEAFQTNLRCDVDPKARIYLLIKAENFKAESPAATSAITADYIPSMSMKCKWTWEMAI